MAAKAKFPGRRVNRSERSSLSFAQNNGLGGVCSRNVDVQDSNRNFQDLANRLSGLRNYIGESDEVCLHSFRSYCSWNVRRNTNLKWTFKCNLHIDSNNIPLAFCQSSYIKHAASWTSWLCMHLN